MVRSYYQELIRADLLKPQEFWQMHPDEFWWWYEAKLKNDNNETLENMYEELDVWASSKKASEKNKRV